jgi:hypothetical protein
MVDLKEVLIMANEKTTLEQAATSLPAITLEPAEPVYILPPHPEAHVISDEETIVPEEPTVADETLEDLVQSAVAGLRGELLQELQIERGGIENAKNKELSIG